MSSANDGSRLFAVRIPRSALLEFVAVEKRLEPQAALKVLQLFRCIVDMPHSLDDRRVILSILSRVQARKPVWPAHKQPFSINFLPSPSDADH